MIEYTIEILHHFKCNDCKKWWSIADWTKTQTMSCPFCTIESMDVIKSKK